MPDDSHRSIDRDDVVVPLRRSGSHDGDAGALDAIVVGGGAIGLACAWRAARLGLTVRVLERDKPGAGASGVAAGMLAPVGEANWGEPDLMRMAIASARAWPQFASELAADSQLEVGYEVRGALHVALDRDEADELRRRFELLDSLDLGVEWLRPRMCRDLEPGLAPSCTAGVHAPQEAAVDPRLLVPALAAAVERRGGQLLIEAEVTDALIEGDRLVGVTTADGREHRAARVVLATGAWSGTTPWLAPDARPPVRPVKGQILVLRGSPELVLCDPLEGAADGRITDLGRERGRLGGGERLADARLLHERRDHARPIRTDIDTADVQRTRTDLAAFKSARQRAGDPRVLDLVERRALRVRDQIRRGAEREELQREP